MIAKEKVEFEERPLSEANLDDLLDIAKADKFFVIKRTPFLDCFKISVRALQHKNGAVSYNYNGSMFGNARNFEEFVEDMCFQLSIAFMPLDEESQLKASSYLERKRAPRANDCKSES